MGRQLDDTSAKILTNTWKIRASTSTSIIPPRLGWQWAFDGDSMQQWRYHPLRRRHRCRWHHAQFRAGTGRCRFGDDWGVHVDDTLTTADERIHAVGECASWRGKRVGTTAGARAQALVLAARLKGDRTRRFPVAHRGKYPQNRRPSRGIRWHGKIPEGDNTIETVLFSDLRRNVYQRCLVQHDRLIGALTIGTLDGFSGWCDLIFKGTELENLRDDLLRSGGG